jgi:prepilin-type N-terminal cleavage/methylation domain-containing protein
VPAAGWRRHARRDRPGARFASGGRRAASQCGFSLLESVIALAVLGGLVVAVSTVVPVLIKALENAHARELALEAAEVALESARGGLVPMESGEVSLDGVVSTPPGVLVRAQIEVIPEPGGALYEVRAVGTVRGGVMLSARAELRSMVWLPGS